MPSLVPLDNSLGAGFIAVTVSAIVFGITCLQVYLYYTQHSSRDPPLLKWFVGILMVLDAFQQSLLFVFYYHYAVTNFGDYVELQKITWSIVIQVIIGHILAISVHLFFACKVYALSQGSLIAPIAIVILSIAQLATSLGFTITSFKITLFSEVTADIGWGTSGLAVDIVSDFIIATSMIYRLNKGKTSFRRTNSAINLLIKYVLNTCLLTGFCNIVNMVLFIVESDNLIYTPFYFLLIRLYSCSLMSTLNSRDNVRKELDAHRTGGVVNMSSFILRTLDSDETATAGSMKLDNKWMSNKPNTQTGTIDSV